MTTPNESRDQLGKIAFEAYKDEVGGVAISGKPIPEWEELGDKVRAGWCAAAEAVEDANVL